MEHWKWICICEFRWTLCEVSTVVYNAETNIWDLDSRTVVWNSEGSNGSKVDTILNDEAEKIIRNCGQ